MRYRLRTLLLVIGALCVWLGLRVNATRKQQSAVAAIERLGGGVYYDYQRSRDGSGRKVIRPDAPFPYPHWLRPLVDAIAPPAVVSVRLGDTAATDRDLELLKALPDVRHLDLRNTTITDDGLIPVGQLRQLDSLSLVGVPIGDGGLANLKKLPLEYLSLWKTNVTDAGVHHLRGMTTLRSLVLDETQITDAALADVGQLTNLEEWLGLTNTQVTDDGVGHLANLKKLKMLNLIDTRVSKDAVQKLRKALPKTSISTHP